MEDKKIDLNNKMGYKVENHQSEELREKLEKKLDLKRERVLAEKFDEKKLSMIGGGVFRKVKVY